MIWALTCFVHPSDTAFLPADVLSQTGASPDFKTGVTHVLIDKVKHIPRPAWSPDTLVEVPDDEVVFNFFNRDSKFLKATPKLEKPKWFKATSDSMDPMRYALPREEDIGKVVRGADGASAALAVTTDHLQNRFSSRTRGKEGVKEKIAEVVKRRCRVEPDSSGEWLVWRS